VYTTTGIHGRHEHEARRIGERHERPGDGDPAVLQGLTEDFEDVLLELGELVQEQNSVMGHGNLPRAGRVPSSDQSDVRDCVMWAAKRPLRHESVIPAQKPHNAVNLGGFDGLFEGHPGEDGRNPAGKHGLAGARRADHDDVVGSRRSHLQCTLCVFLPLDLGKVVTGFKATLEESSHVDPVGSDIPLTVQELNHFGKLRDTDNVDSLDHRPLWCVFPGDDDSGKSGGPCRHCHGKAAANRLYAAVKGQFTEEKVLLEPLTLDDAGGRQDADGDGKVEGCPLFLQVGRGQVDGDLAGGEIVTGVLQGRLDPVLALLDGAVGEADGGELGKPLGDVHLHVDDNGVNTQEGAGKGLGEHGLLLYVQVALGVKGGHAAGAGGGDGLAVVLVLDVAGGKDAGDAGGGKVPLAAALGADVAAVHLQLPLEEERVGSVADGDEAAVNLEILGGAAGVADTDTGDP